MPGTTPGRKTFVFLIVYLTGSTPFISISGILSAACTLWQPYPLYVRPLQTVIVVT